jgi:Kef-type K+ transport system membrane component KefB
MELSFTNLLIIVAIGFAAPLALGFVPALRVPSIVVEIVLGIVVGPAVLGWVHVDDPVAVFSTVGLAFLLFLAGLEIDFGRLRGRVLRLALTGFAASLVLAVVVGLLLKAGGLVSQPLFVAIVLSATSLGVLVPVLKDAGESGTAFGQLIIAAGTIADFATVILLSLFFSRQSGSTAAKVILLAGLFLVAALLALAIAGVEHSRRVRETLRRLQDTTAQIRVRAAFLLLVGLVALAAKLGLEVILGAFIAGAIISLVDQDRAMTHAAFRRKLEAAGFGIFIPVFFVTTGVKYDLDALTAHASTLLHVPIFLAALVVVRGLPALLYRSVIPPGRVAVAALMQATSLPFIVAATSVGLALHVVTPANAAALIAAGLLSVVLFPAASLVLLRRDPRDAVAMDAAMTVRKAGMVGGLQTLGDLPMDDLDAPAPAPAGRPAPAARAREPVGAGRAD